MRITKLQLLGYLFDNVSALMDDMNNLGIEFDFEYFMLRSEVLLIACKSAKSVTLEKIHDAFEKLAQCRARFRELLTEKYGEQAWQAHLKYSDKTAPAVVEEKQEEQAEDRKGNGFHVNKDVVIATHHVEEYEDKKQISEQLEEAPLLASLSVDDMYAKRASIMYHLTDGAEVLEAKAVMLSDYFTRFMRQLSIALDELKRRVGYFDYIEKYGFWFGVKDRILRGVLYNNISPEDMETYNIRSPKFSKYLIKTFGEKSEIVKLFNDRPKADQTEQVTPQVIKDMKVVVSNLACNVMKMTAHNAFNSCQDYTYDSYDSLETLDSLPSSVHDETLSIAYLTYAYEDYMFPTMKARILISPFEYKGNLFYVGYNLYGRRDDADLLVSSLKYLYGDRFLFARDLYRTDDMVTWQYDYGYTLRVDFYHDTPCYLCEGNGTVRATVREYDYDFICECPRCEGVGKDYDGDWGSYPYVNESSYIYYRGNAKEVEVDRKILERILEEESQEKSKEYHKKVLTV